jgi:hypothetical protein
VHVPLLSTLYNIQNCLLTFRSLFVCLFTRIKSTMVERFLVLCKVFEEDCILLHLGLEVPLLFVVMSQLLRGLSLQARTIPTKRPPLVGEVSANFSG